MINNTITLKPTAAIGDVVMASSLVPSLLEKGCQQVNIISEQLTLPLWQGLPGVGKLMNANDRKAIDISDYHQWMPTSTMLPKEFTGEAEDRFAHLCEWMAYSFFEKSGIQVLPSRENVKIILTPEEVEQGKQEIYEISKTHNNLPVVIIAPYATVKNRSLSESTLDDIIRGISGFATPFELKKSPHLRYSSAILYASDAFIGVDSGPLHMINGALQGTPLDLGTNLNTSKNKVVVVLGSSHPGVVTYSGNQVIKTFSDCNIAPCGIHGYWPIEEYEKRFRMPIYSTQKDKSGCKYNEYDILETSPCMKAIIAEQIIETVRQIIKG